LKNDVKKEGAMRAKYIAAGIVCGILCMVVLYDAYPTPLKIKFAYQYSSNYPFQTGEGNEIDWEKPGIAVELLMLAGEKMNIDIEFIRLPWKRGLHELKFGRIDGLFNASFKTERLEFGVYPMKEGVVDQHRRSYTNSYVLYKVKGTPIQWDGKTFHNLTRSIGATRGFSIVDDLIKQGIRVEEANSTSQNFERLINGRIDGVAALELDADYIVETYKDKFSNIEKAQPPLVTKPYYLLLSHQFVKMYPELAEEIWNTIAVVRESEEFKQRTQKYFQ